MTFDDEKLLERPNAGVVAVKDQPERIDLRDLVRQAMADHDGIVADAVDAVFGYLTDNPDKLRAVLTHAALIAAHTLAEQDMRGTRVAIMNAAAKPAAAPKGADNSALLARATVRSTTRQLLDYPLATGIKLRDATREQVETQRDRHTSLAKNNDFKARWFGAIAFRTPPGRKVGDVLSEADVQSMHKGAFHD